MNIYYLSAELLIDAVALILGIVLIFRKTDNLPKFYWGVIAALIGLVFIWENIGWVVKRTQDPVYEYKDILNIEKMLKFYILASIVSLYPLASLKPGYLTKFRTALYMIPPIVILTVGVCYLFFNGHITKVDSFAQIRDYIDLFDIRLRLTIFLFTLITPLFYFLGPLVGSRGPRRINNMMYIFVGFMFLLLGLYILFTLFVCDLFFNGFGFLSILFSIFFSVQYLRNENPLSYHVEVASTLDDDISEEKELEGGRVEVTGDSLISPLFQQIENYLKENRDYTNANFSLENLSKSVRESEKDVSTAIKSAGYSGFKEYVNRLRLEHFRYLVSQDQDRTTKELWIECGFPSKATFYRQFSLMYHEAPREFIEKQRSNI